MTTTLSSPIRTFPAMSCVPLSPDHRQVLELLARGGPVPSDQTPVLDELRQWGWVMKSGS